jgi:predicted PurR-regulated permease PerM
MDWQILVMILGVITGVFAVVNSIAGFIRTLIASLKLFYDGVLEIKQGVKELQQREDVLQGNISKLIERNTELTTQAQEQGTLLTYLSGRVDMLETDINDIFQKLRMFHRVRGRK